MLAKLVVVSGEPRNRKFVLELPAVIGRSRSTDLQLGHPLVSRRHCEVFERQGQLMLRDLGSLNGTFQGDLRLTDEPVAIQPGDRFNVGPITLQAEYQSRADGVPDEAGGLSGRTIDSPLLPGEDNDTPLTD